MELQSACSSLHAPKLRLPTIHRSLSHQPVSPSSSVCLRPRSRFRFKCGTQYQISPNSYLLAGFGSTSKDSSAQSFKRGVTVCASKSNSEGKLRFSRRDVTAPEASEAFRGKSGSVSFYGLTHQLVEEGKLVSAPFKESDGSFLWVLPPVVLITSLVLPQFFRVIAIDGLIKNEILAEMVVSMSSEVIFYIGLGTFLLVTDRVQKPYLQFSPKRWGLITGLRGYLSSAFFVMGFKVFAPLFAVFVTWPILGLPAAVAIAPFLVGCLAQYAFEISLGKRGSSCWPLVPIIFELYRLFQLTKAVNFIERLMYAMRDVPLNPKTLEKGTAMVSMIVTFQILGVVCLWSLITFLLRLFPSRPVAENY